MQPDEYPRLAALEDSLWYCRALRAHLRRELLHAAGAGPLALLDAGCGTGGFLREVSALHPAWDCAGVDLSPAACALARQRSPATPVAEASVLALPFPDARFDAVVSADVLYHLDDDHTALLEMRRTLAPGGQLVVNVPAYPWLWSYHDVAVEGRRRYTRRGLRERLARAGFADIRTTHWNLLPLPLLILRRKVFAPRRPRGSDVRALPGPLGCFLRGLAALEQAWLRSGWDLPAGSSLLAVARRPPM